MDVPLLHAFDYQYGAHHPVCSRDIQVEWFPFLRCDEDRRACEDPLEICEGCFSFWRLLELVRLLHQSIEW